MYVPISESGAASVWSECVARLVRTCLHGASETFVMALGDALMSQRALYDGDEVAREGTNLLLGDTHTTRTNTNIRAHAHTHARTYTHTHTRTCTHTHARTRTRAPTHTHTHMHTRTRAHTRTHAHMTHIHIHPHTDAVFAAVVDLR